MIGRLLECIYRAIPQQIKVEVWRVCPSVVVMLFRRSVSVSSKLRHLFWVGGSNRIRVEFLFLFFTEKIPRYVVF